MTGDDVKALLRACFVAPPGHVLLDADLNAIEPRTALWAAGDYEGLAAFDRGDPYIDLAAKIYNRPRETIKKGSQERQLGKAGKIGCFAADTPVLTRQGFKPIIDVTSEDYLWDGNEWVQSAGCVPQGIRPVISLAGVELTAEHKVLCGGRWLEASQLLHDADTLCLSLETASTTLSSPAMHWGSAAESLPWSFSVIAGAPSTQCSTTIYGTESPVAAALAPKLSLTSGERSTAVMRTCCPTMPIGPAYLTESRQLSSVVGGTGPTPKTTPCVGSAFTRNGRQTAVPSCATSSRCRDGITLISKSTAATTTGAMSPATYVSSRASRTCTTAERSPQCRRASMPLRPVYDIVNAGPRSRFTIWTDRGPLIVHNCIYGLGNPDRFQEMAAKPPYCVDWSACPVTPAEVIATARAAIPGIVKMWAGMQDAAVLACDGYTTTVGPYTWGPSPIAPGRDVWMMLPSGRPIVYYQLSYTLGRRGPELTFLGRKGRSKVYGGLFLENATQALDRDILGLGVVRCEAGWDGGEPLPVVLHAHDAIIALSRRERADENLARMMAMMTVTPDFTPGLTLKAEGFWAERHRK